MSMPLPARPRVDPELVDLEAAGAPAGEERESGLLPARHAGRLDVHRVRQRPCCAVAVELTGVLEVGPGAVDVVLDVEEDAFGALDIADVEPRRRIVRRDA